MTLVENYISFLLFPTSALLWTQTVTDEQQKRLIILLGGERLEDNGSGINGCDCEMTTPAEQKPTWTTCFKLPPSFLLLLLLSLHRWGWWWWVQGTSVNLSFVREGDGNGEQFKKTKKSSFINPSIRSHTGLISSVCFTSQCKYMCVRARVCVKCVWCVFGACVWDSFGKTSQRLGMFHSILKHAEHRTLNTYTEQLVLSKCSFSFFLSLFAQSGFRLHRTRQNQSHQVGHIALNHQIFVYMSCMPHRWYYVYTKITPTPITVYHSNYRKQIFFSLFCNEVQLRNHIYVYVLISNIYIHIHTYMHTRYKYIEIIYKYIDIYVKWLWLFQLWCSSSFF